MKVLVTGANGFIGKNLVMRLRERADTEVLTLMREDGDSAWQAALAQADAVVHLAGENRPTDPAAFDAVNTNLTQRLCDTLQSMSERGYGTHSEYVRELIRKDQDRQQLRSLLLAGAASAPSHRVNDAYFADLRQRVRTSP